MTTVRDQIELGPISPELCPRNDGYRPVGKPDNNPPYIGTRLETAALSDFRLAETFERAASAPVLERCQRGESPSAVVPRGL